VLLRIAFGAILVVAGMAAAVFSTCAGAEEIVAVYAAYWAGLPAADIKLRLSDDSTAYHDQIEIQTEGLPALLSRFRATASAEGRLASGDPAEPEHYDAIYDLRKRRNSRVSMRFTARAGALIAERGPQDTSHKPPLAEGFRQNAVDPLTAIERIRGALRLERQLSNTSFSIPVYDGARRFDILGHILAKQEPDDRTLRVELTLRPIAGFKGETSEDGDPDSAPRKVELTVTDDARLIPLSITVPVFFLPLVVRFDHLCTGSCSEESGSSSPVR
jgi:Protein of unknown function (DUF3108)